ncbi:hypothetical protein ACOMHN_017609 [Nucella lapillus]
MPPKSAKTAKTASQSSKRGQQTNKRRLEDDSTESQTFLERIQDRLNLKRRKTRVLFAAIILATILLLIIVACLGAFLGKGGGSSSSASTLHPDCLPGAMRNGTDSEAGKVTRSPDQGSRFEGSGSGVVDLKAIALYHSWFKGDGTYYGPEGEGTCQINKDNLPPAARNSKYLAALNAPQFRKSAACSMCFRVKGEGTGLGSDPITGDFTVFIKDLCPECNEGDVDLAIDGDGRWDIEIQAIQCPVNDTYIQYQFQGSNAFYLKLQVRNVRVPPHKVAVKDSKGTWVQMTLSKDGHWVGSSQFDKTGNLPVRLTSIAGASVDDVIPRLVNDAVMEGTKQVQFPLDLLLPDSSLKLQINNTVSP